VISCSTLTTTHISSIWLHMPQVNFTSPSSTSSMHLLKVLSVS
jgi:hypothetical protein